MNIGRADQLGSGVRNLYKYTKLYSGGEPELIEGDLFKTIIPLPRMGEKQANDLQGWAGQVNHVAQDRINDRITKTQERILSLIAENPHITAPILSTELGINERNVLNNIKSMKDSGLIRRVGARKNGYWEIISKA